MFHQKTLFSSRGQISIILIFAIFLVGGVYVLSKVKVSPVAQAPTETCVSIDNSKTVQFRGEPYIKIRDNTYLSLDIFNLHIPKQPETINSREVYMPETRCQRHQADPADPNYTNGCNDIEKDLPSSVDYLSSVGGLNDPENIKAKDLLFVTVPTNTPPAGFTLAEIYLRQGYLTQFNKIPDFITKFCTDKNQPTVPRIISGDENTAVPPLHILKKDMIPPPPELNNNVYTLIGYERTDGWFAKDMSKDPTSFTYANKGKVYDVRVRSYARYAYLIDRADPTYAYFYSSNIPVNSSIPIPSINSTNALQIKTFDFVDKIYPWGWWTPECKPAIYLYPEKEMKVHVAVNPAGFLTYTDPLYPKSGWEVMAKPNGEIISSDKPYPYLYYESKIKDSAINKPKKGYIVPFSQIPEFYSTVLPQLGLNNIEVRDFKDYWEKYLPYSLYYFIGIMEDKDIESIEPLTISPKPTTIIRVRLYFEALDNLSKVLEKSTQVAEPTIKTPQRDGFTVVEWGGLVKVDKEHPFTCSQ